MLIHWLMSKTAERIQWGIIVLAAVYFAAQVVRWWVM